MAFQQNVGAENKNLRYGIASNDATLISNNMENSPKQEKLSKPELNFEAFWRIFEDNYSNFKLKNIDWKTSYATYRSKVNSNTTDEELFTIFSEMLKPFNDSHVSITAPSINRSFIASKESRIVKEMAKYKSRRKAFEPMVDSTLVKHGFAPTKAIGPESKIIGGYRLFNYTKNSEVGYLRFLRCFNRYPIPLFVNSFQKYLDDILTEFEGLDVVIIDIRFNLGGFDKFSEGVASRFIEKEMVGYCEQKRNGGYEDFDKIVSHKIKPSRRIKFTKPIILLTNDMSVSAGDVFALIMSQLPNVTIVGENSNGSFSDILTKKLPNGWSVNLSNERYYSADMVNYEGVGVPVDVEAKNTLENFENFNDSVLTKALQLLKEKKKNN
jgi:hypothetical protein